MLAITHDKMNIAIPFKAPSKTENIYIYQLCLQDIQFYFLTQLLFLFPAHK